MSTPVTSTVRFNKYTRWPFLKVVKVTKQYTHHYISLTGLILDDWDGIFTFVEVCCALPLKYTVAESMFGFRREDWSLDDDT